MSKYGNTKITREGITFDSMREYKHYLYLCSEVNAQEITDLQLQVKFDYMNDANTNKLFTYIADFTYNDLLGHLHVVDAKGCKTPVYNLKKKLIENRFKIKIEEV